MYSAQEPWIASQGAPDRMAVNAVVKVAFENFKAQVNQLFILLVQCIAFH